MVVAEASSKGFAVARGKLRLSGRHRRQPKGQIVALVKKGSRRIVVDGVTYRWRIRHKPTYCQANGWNPLTFAVEDATVPGTALVVRTDRTHPGNWFGLPTKPVLPADVVQAIRTALARGWTPYISGTPFHLEISSASKVGGGSAPADGLSA
ncbi:hypothetical protein [Streptomyces microflavus]|uniref:hypothetical protein n=1 Tax=Streptomyces microflavus TaxID=1919 RepID=UPI00345497AD